ncbi:CHAT domain-containing tetratricopeptide repeat protein [uncultured Winogradskyella sp.]|uniref:CHAT domain-containing protein n=1 Tax=uncultured Winogradskyella sp. TaxID=395353 RepID=UPI002634850A|nr:CHAT domain-containing tetratricopeptide repeat protein [uncultured Winogradskyella sp.]
MLNKNNIIIFCLIIQTHTYAQSARLTGLTIKDYTEAKYLIDKGHFVDAIPYINAIKDVVSEQASLEKFEDFEFHCSIMVLDITIKREQKKYDEALKIITDLKTQLKEHFDLKKSDVFATFTTIIVEEYKLLFEKNIRKTSLNTLESVRKKLLKNFDFKNEKILNSYAEIVGLEMSIYLKKKDTIGASKLQFQRANAIKGSIINKKLPSQYYLRLKEDAIDNFVNSRKDSITLSKATVYLKDLLDDYDTIGKILDPRTRQRGIWSASKKYMNYRFILINPFSYSEELRSKAYYENTENTMQNFLKEVQNTNYNAGGALSTEIGNVLNKIEAKIDQSIVSEGNYQDYKTINDERIKNNDNSKYFFSYYHSKLKETEHLYELEMYNQIITTLKTTIEELDDSGLKSDITTYLMFKRRMYSNLFVVNYFLGDFETALKYLKLAEKTTKYIPNVSITYLDIYHAYQTLYISSKEYDKAVDYGKKILKLEKYKAKINYDIMAKAYYYNRDFDNAIIWFKKYITYLTTESKDSNKTHLQSQAYHFIGLSFLAKNNFDKAEYFLQLAITNLKDLEKSNDFKYLESVISSDFANLYLKKRNVSMANKNMIAFCESFTDIYLEELLEFTEEKRKKNLENDYGPETLFRFIDESNEWPSKIIGHGFDYAVLSKQLLLNTTESISNSISEDYKSTDLDSINTNWKLVKNQLRNVSVLNRDSLMDYARVYEKELLKRGKKVILKRLQENTITWQTVKQNLNKDESVIEFVKFKDTSNIKNHKINYGAFVLSKNSKSPTYVSLFNELELRQIIENTTQKFKDPKSVITELYKAKGSLLYNYIWLPIEKVLDESHKIYIAPTGILQNIAFSALPINSKLSLGEKYNIIRINSSKDIANSNISQNFNQALLFGGITYVLNQEIEDQTNVKTRSSKFTELPGTLKEVNALEEILKSNNIITHKKIGFDASEENFINSTFLKPEIIHIGTHAFYLKPLKNEFGFTEMLGSVLFINDKNPMNRSGLALAKANYFWQYGENFNNRKDGILTANEIASLDLKNVELVVLSACETALGESEGNEGVFGLQRGLKIAGAKNLLLSLWKVDDNVTQEYMEDFYTNIFTNNLSIREAFFKTQKNIKTKYPNPYFWGAFVLIQ